MATLTPAQIAKYAYTAGFRGVDLIRAVAIALAESGGRTDAYNPETAAGTRPGSGSRGLWQIYGTAHPQYNNASAFDPAINAKAAYQVYREAGGKFTPWTTWTKGVANQYLNQAQAAASGSLKQVSSMAGTVTNVASAAQTGTRAASGGLGLLPDLPALVTKSVTGVRDALLGKTAEGEQRETADLMFFLGGAVLIMIGLIFLFVNSDGGQKLVAATGEAARTAAKAAVL